MKSTDQEVILTKSSDQYKWFKQAIKRVRRVIFNKTSICRAFLMEYQAIKNLS